MAVTVYLQYVFILWLMLFDYSGGRLKTSKWSTQFMRNVMQQPLLRIYCISGFANHKVDVSSQIAKFVATREKLIRYL